MRSFIKKPDSAQDLPRTREVLVRYDYTGASEDLQAEKASTCVVVEH